MSTDQIALIIIGSAVLLSVLLALIATGMSGRVSEEERRRELERGLQPRGWHGDLR